MDKVNMFESIDLSTLGLSKNESNPNESKDEKQTNFMTLLVAQLENQNPMEPQDNAQFIAQLAQFESLDGIKKLNDNFTSLASSMSSNQALQASTLVGQSVTVPASTANYTEGDPFYGSIDLDRSVTDLRVQIKDGSGALIKEEQIGVAAAGVHSFNWDGTNNSKEPMSSGMYSVSAVGVMNGESVELATNLTFNVDSVTIGRAGQGISLNLGEFGSVSMDDVKEIR